MSDIVSVEKVDIDLGGAVKQSFELLKANVVLLSVSALLLCLVSGFTGTLLLGPMMMGMFIICDRLVTGKGGKPTIGDLFNGLSFFVPGLLLELLGYSGSVLCGVFALLTWPVASWAMMRIADTGMSIGDAISDAFHFIFKEGNCMFILVWFVSNILASIGVIACFVGIYFTIPFMFLIPVCVYRQVHRA